MVPSFTVAVCFGFMFLSLMTLVHSYCSQPSLKYYTVLHSVVGMLSVKNTCMGIEMDFRLGTDHNVSY